LGSSSIHHFDEPSPLIILTMTNQNSYSLPTTLHTSPSTAPKKAWRERLNFKSSNAPSSNAGANSSVTQSSAQETPGLRQTSSAMSKPEKWWEVKLFRGMINDIRRRAPFYVSDWVDAWDYRVVPATVYMYFAKYVAILITTFKKSEN